jgi:GMP synthase (glutamine-hydrolysing)
MKIHIVMHECFEAPGAIELWAKKHNFPITYTHLYKGELLPNSTGNFDYLIIMGGPRSPATTKVECPHFDAQAEINLIAKAVKQNKFVLGICLGAQLIGEALGAKFEHSPNREIGVFELTQTETGLKDPIFSTFPKKFPVGHWHGDMPGLTTDTALLAYSKGCPRQIVRYTPRVFGFQCHFEFTPETIEGMIANCGNELKTFQGLPYIENAETLRKHNYEPINELLYRFLDYMNSLTPPL